MTSRSRMGRGRWGRLLQPAPPSDTRTLLINSAQDAGVTPGTPSWILARERLEETVSEQ